MKVFSIVVKYNIVYKLVFNGIYNFYINIKAVQKSTELDLVKISCLPEQKSADA